MDRDVIVRKLESLRRHLRRIESKRPFTQQQLEMDDDLQDIVAHNLAQAVQVAVDIGMHLISDSDVSVPETMGEVFERLAQNGVIPAELALRLRAAVGFRNIAMHAYGQLHWPTVFDICETRLSDLREFASWVAGFADARGKEGS